MCVKRPRVVEKQEYIFEDNKVVLESQNSENKRGMNIGAHVSAAGGLHNAFSNIGKVSGHAMALFLKNQRRWDAPVLEANCIDKFKSVQEECRFSSNNILPHGSYLINLGNPDKEKREKSFGSFVDDITRCHLLGIKLYNFHPGSTVGACTINESIKTIAESIDRAHKLVPDVCLVLETMAGQGNCIGNKFQELRDIIKLVKDKSRVGVCIDTCHIFAAGYDIRSKKAYTKTMEEFSKIIGFEYLKGVHLNDSKTELGSGKDRHENIGIGKIGINAFRHIMNDKRFMNIPMVLETPVPTGSTDTEIYSHEIRLLYSLIGTEEGNE